MDKPAVRYLGTGRVFVAASSREGHLPYLVAEVDGVWSCSCPAVVLCRHIREAIDAVQGAAV